MLPGNPDPFINPRGLMMLTALGDAHSPWGCSQGADQGQLVPSNVEELVLVHWDGCRVGAGRPVGQDGCLAHPLGFGDNVSCAEGALGGKHVTFAVLLSLSPATGGTRKGNGQCASVSPG